MDSIVEQHIRPYSVSQVGGPSILNSSRTKVMSTEFQLDSRYEIREVLGAGAYGVVVSAYDSLLGENVAIKKIEKAFEHLIFTKRALRELKILRLLDHENIIKIKSLQLPKSRQDLNEIYVMNELMENDLTEIIRSPQHLSDDHCKFFLYQILRALKYMHSAHIIHRDLKPRNILVKSNCDLKICDFGLARYFFDEEEIVSAQMTEYVATRWYRPPELLLNFKKYTTAIDMWSVGTIFGELLMRRPILPGNDANHQIDLIFDLNGTPSIEDIEAIPNSKTRERLLKMPGKRAVDYETVFRNTNPSALDLLKKMLVFNPDKRISIDDALAHPYLSPLHCEDDEPTTSPLSLYDFQFERQDLSIENFKDLIYDEILLYHFPDKLEEYNRNLIDFDNNR